MTAEKFGRYLAEKDLGRLKLDDWVLGKADYPDNDELGGFHHMGGIRIASNSNAVSHNFVASQVAVKQQGFAGT
jgi:hypothetical protein